jgi:hypothetical protein
LTKWDVTVADRIAARVPGKTAGAVPLTGVGSPGTKLFAEDKTIRVLIHSATAPMNFTRCVCRDPIEINKGTRFSTLVLEFEAHKDANRVLFNAETT